MTKESPAEILKQQRKEAKEKKMKNLKTKLKTPFTVLATVAVVVALYALYSVGVDHGKAQQKLINQEVATQVASKTSQE